MQFGKCREYPFLIPVVTLRLETITVQTRALRMGWTREMAQDIEAIQSIDAEAELTAVLTEELNQAGLIYAPYIPMQLEPLIIGNFEPREGIATRYATRMVDSRYYGFADISQLPDYYIPLQFPRLKRLQFWNYDNEFDSIQFPLIRRVFSIPIPNHVEENDRAMTRQLLEWARLINEARITH